MNKKENREWHNFFDVYGKSLRQMKGLTIIVLISFSFSVISLAQHHVSAAFGSENYKVTLAKNSISIADWHEKPFWSLYESYANRMQQPASFFYLSLDSLLNEDRNDRHEPNRTERLISSEKEALNVTQRYFGEISSNFNGTIALQFLQTEMLFDIVENLRVYENHPERRFSFYPWSFEPQQNKLSKRDAIIETLDLSLLEQENFFKLYRHYEQECSDLLGEDYNIFSIFNEDPAEYTPAMAKDMARNLLQLWQRELTLKEKYFVLLNHDYGPSLASRFIMWENYYAAIGKMYAWSDESAPQVQYWTSQR